MKAMILTAMILAAPIICAQSMSLYECIYQYDINGKTAKGDLSETYCCMLQIGEENSRFIDYAAFQLDSVSAIKGISDVTVQKKLQRSPTGHSPMTRKRSVATPAGKRPEHTEVATGRYGTPKIFLCLMVHGNLRGSPVW